MGYVGLIWGLPIGGFALSTWRVRGRLAELGFLRLSSDQLTRQVTLGPLVKESCYMGVNPKMVIPNKPMGFPTNHEVMERVPGFPRYIFFLGPSSSHTGCEDRYLDPQTPPCWRPLGLRYLEDFGRLRLIHILNWRTCSGECQFLAGNLPMTV